MTESKPKYPLGSPQEHIEMCKTHDLPIDVICEDCDEFICGKSAKTDHRDHDWSTIPTAASQTRRGLLKFLKKIKEEDLPWIDGKIEKIPQQITENKELCDSEIKKIQKHVDEIMARLSEIKEHNEQRLRDHLEEKNEKLKSNKSELYKKKKEISDLVKFMEDNKSCMSDYSLLDNHRELKKLLSALDIDLKNSKHSLRYRKGDISDELLKNMIGKTLDFNHITLIETSSFKYGNKPIVLLRALCEDQCCIRHFLSDCTEQINSEGKKQHKYTFTPDDLCVTDTGDVYFTDNKKNSIGCLSKSGSVSTIISTYPLVPRGICQSVDGGLLVTLIDMKSHPYKLEPHSRRLVRHITVTGDVIHEYEYQADGQTRLFIFPRRVTQNCKSDICVVNRTSDTTGDLVFMTPSGRMKFVYSGQDLREDFWPGNAVCDSLCNILVPDINNKQIHLLDPDGAFLKFLLKENEVNRPSRLSRLSLYKSTLWVGYWEGHVKVFQYRL